MNAYKGYSNILWLQFELPFCKMDDGRPFLVGRKFSLSLNERAHLRAFIESWRAKNFTEQELAGFEIGTLLGRPCVLQLVERMQGDRTYVNIQNVMGWTPAEGELPELHNEVFMFDLNDPESMEAHFSKLSENMQKRVMESMEMQHQGDQPKPQTPQPAVQVTSTDFDDDVPF